MKGAVAAEVADTKASLQAQLQAGSIVQADHDFAVGQLDAYAAAMDTNIDRRGACPASAGLAAFNFPGYPASGDLLRTILPADTFYGADVAAGGTLVDLTLTPPGLLTYNDLLPASTTSCAAPSCACTKLEALAADTVASRAEAVQNNVISRLDRTNGRLGAQKARKLELLKNVLDNQPALYEFIVDLSTGLEPIADPEEAVLDDLIGVYVSGPLAYGVNGQPNIADSLLQRTTILDLNVTTNATAIGVLAERCQARRHASWRGLRDASLVRGQVAHLRAPRARAGARARD